MYASQVDGQRLTFGVSGLLWRRSLVMYDEETNSYWSHILGRAMAGELKGAQLVQIPAVMTNWASWRQSYPDTTAPVLTRIVEAYRSGIYNKKLAGFGLGIADEGNSKFWSFASMAETPVIEDTWQGAPVVVLFDKASNTPRLFRRMLGGRVLSFLVSRLEGSDDVFRDVQTDSIWDAVSGSAVSGPLKGQQLEPLTAFVSHAEAWEAFHFDSDGK